MIFVEAILTYFVWVHGYGWLSLIPIVAGLVAGLCFSAGVGVSGGNLLELLKKKDPKISTADFFIDLIIVFALIIMLVAK